VPAVQDLIHKVETNETYSMVAATLDRMLAKVGLRRTRKIKLYEVVRCPHCMQDIPLESKVCMHCRKEVVLR
jgi:predicted amidophosphoribosyltransferase